MSLSELSTTLSPLTAAWRRAPSFMQSRMSAPISATTTGSKCCKVTHEIKAPLGRVYIFLWPCMKRERCENELGKRYYFTKGRFDGGC